MPAPHFSTSQDGVQSNPRSKGGICSTALHPCSLLPPHLAMGTPRLHPILPPPHSCSWPDQRASPGGCLTLNPSARKENAMISISQGGN